MSFKTMMVQTRKLNLDNKLFLIVFGITLTCFIFTNNAHRYSFDEDISQKQAMYIVNGKPGELYVPGNSTVLYEYPIYWPLDWQRSHATICTNAILCSKADIGHSLTEVPFISINHYLHFFTTDTVVWSSSDFDDPAYVYWRNSIDPDFTFLQFFYGPIFSALSVGIFFLVCRSFDFSHKNSLMLALLYGFTTLLWAYSKTSLNIVPSTFFILLGFWFFRKFQRNNSKISLILCSTSLGFDFLVRQDVVLIIVPLFFFFLYDLKKRNSKLKSFVSFTMPVFFLYVIYIVLNFVRYGSSYNIASASPSAAIPTVAPTMSIVEISSAISEAFFGLLLSPGVGLLIFVPILASVFFSFPDFYRRNKPECILFLSFVVLFMIFYGAHGGGSWHGLIAWGPRYLVSIIPFLLLPLGASFEKRKNKSLKIILISLAGLGFFFNVVYMIQDVSWFVWGNASLHTGLFGIEKNGLYDLNIHPATIWTFEFSQLTQSINTAFTHLQSDIFLLKILGPILFGLSFTALMIVLCIIIWHLMKSPYVLNKT